MSSVCPPQLSTLDGPHVASASDSLSASVGVVLVLALALAAAAAAAGGGGGLSPCLCLLTRTLSRLVSSVVSTLVVSLLVLGDADTYLATLFALYDTYSCFGIPWATHFRTRTVGCPSRLVLESLGCLLRHTLRFSHFVVHSCPLGTR